MKAKEHIYNLRTNLEAAGSQLQVTTDQHVMYMLDSARAILASQKMDTNVAIPSMVQTVDLVPKKADSKDLGSIGDLKVIKLELPKPISYSKGSAIISVGSIDGAETYSETTLTSWRLTMHRKYTANTSKYILLDNVIYIINRDIDAMSKIRVTGVFDEPYKVEIAMGKYKYLDPFGFEYPLSMKDAKTVYQIALDSEMGWGDQALGYLASMRRKQQSNQSEDNQ